MPTVPLEQAEATSAPDTNQIIPRFTRKEKERRTRRFWCPHIEEIIRQSIEQAAPCHFNDGDNCWLFYYYCYSATKVSWERRV